ncbi:hypothetical protein MUB24_09525 [Lederbergia sp. NSJ-179]|nr:hypothetical protein [Lederbergia sp. NSJ-179]MCJ7841129.1 hypothetical protein [Lederbergia sp. NSJ-179]
MIKKHINERNSFGFNEERVQILFEISIHLTDFTSSPTKESIRKIG